MKQWSVYTRYFTSRGQADAAADRIGVQVPPMEKVSMMFVTDKQYGLVRAGTEKKRFSVNFKMTHRACLKVGLVRLFL